ncbi:MAG TPA: adenine deaminase C-terminal domain-containing protein [Chitinophagaceae bacterium]|nr:adenine deaminase C-terminal domain-containing protein [Chitinophagaceae bacterium]
MSSFSVSGNLVDIHQQKIYPAEITVDKGKITSIKATQPSPFGGDGGGFLLPGFIDSHVHIESSMLVPSEFAKLAVVHGTVATVSDPHEIANVCGMDGVEFMIENGKTVPFKFNFGAPSCVPATTFETAGATLDSSDVEKLLKRNDIKYLSEMMNFPGVLNGDEEVMKKIAAAHRMNKPVDGHAPGLRGEDAKRYIQAPLNPPPAGGGTLDFDSSAPLNPPPAGGGTLDSDSSAPLNPPQGGTLDSDSSNKRYNYHTAEPYVYGILKKFVKEHRENPTHAENVLWHLLRQRQLDGYKFRRQHIIGSYIADFVCLNKSLIIEVDGLIHQIPENKMSDAERTFELSKLGFNVIRFTNDDICNAPDKVMSSVLLELSKTTIVKSGSKNPPLEGREALHLRSSGAFPLEGRGAVITTDHECFTKEEALDKLQNGMKIIIREGSAAKNFEALIELLHDYPNQMMFCSDDKHPDSLVLGHINQLCARAVAKGIDKFKVLNAACVNPVRHYNLDVGLLREGDAADFIIVKDLEKFEVVKTYINGVVVAEDGHSKIKTVKSKPINNFSCSKKNVDDFEIRSMSEREIIGANWFHADGPDARRLPVIEALDGQLITNKILAEIEIGESVLQTNIQDDILKIVVVNRYYDAPVAKALIKNFGLKYGALASSVAHDSHNIVAVGVDDESLCKAVNMIIEHRGGVSCVNENVEMIVPLPVAGLMSNEDGYHVAQQYSLIDKAAKDAGSTLAAPFMTLSFMALLVIPHLKLSDKGLFDGDTFKLL